MDMMAAFALVAVAATVLALIAGISSMVADGEVAHYRSEEWMVARVIAQLIALIFVAVASLA